MGQVQVALASDIGRRHHVNQDAAGAWTWRDHNGRSAALVVVADGVSAGRHSEAASRQTVSLVRERLQDALVAGRDAGDALEEAVKEANRAVALRPYEALASADATTVVAVAAVGRQCYGVWVGDSRAYLIRDGQIVALTQDHSWAAEVVRQGLMGAPEAARDPRAHMILRWLGPPDREDPGVDSFVLDLQAGDTILCCSDGLYMYFTSPHAEEREMATILGENQDLQAAVDILVETALKRGGADNITAAALRLP